MESLQLLWKGLLGGSTWMGYAMYALYAVGKDYGFSTETCEAYGYLYVVVDELAVMVEFAQPAASGDCSAEGGSTDLLAAAAAAAAAAAGIKGSDTANEGEAAAAEGDAAVNEGEAAAEEPAPAEGDATE